MNAGEGRMETKEGMEEADKERREREQSTKNVRRNYI